MLSLIWHLMVNNVPNDKNFRELKNMTYLN